MEQEALFFVVLLCYVAVPCMFMLVGADHRFEEVTMNVAITMWKPGWRCATADMKGLSSSLNWPFLPRALVLTEFIR